MDKAVLVVVAVVVVLVRGRGGACMKPVKLGDVPQLQVNTH